MVLSLFASACSGQFANTETIRLQLYSHYDKQNSLSRRQMRTSLAAELLPSALLLMNSIIADVLLRTRRGYR